MGCQIRKRCTTLFPAFVLVWFSVLISQTSGKSKHEEIEEKFLHLDDAKIEKLYRFSRHLKNDLSQDELAELNREKDMVLNPLKVIEEFKQNPDRDGLVRKMTRLNDLSELSDPKAHTISESLEFMVDYITKAEQIEAELDNLIIRYYDTEKTQEQLSSIVKTYCKRLENLIKDAANGIQEFANGQLSKTEMQPRFREIDEKKKKFRAEYLSSSLQNLSTTNFEEFAERRMAWQMEHLKNGDMYIKLFPRHSHILMYAAGIDITIAGDHPYYGKKVEFDIGVVKSLLHNYQLLEGKNNELLVTKDAVAQYRIMTEVNELENIIFDEKMKSMNEFRKLFSYTTSIVVRTSTKMKNADLVLINILEIQNETLNGQRLSIVLEEKFEDLMSESAKMWMGRIPEVRQEL